jgi:hypothetical protein
MFKEFTTYIKLNFFYKSKLKEYIIKCKVVKIIKLNLKLLTSSN